MPVPGDSTDPRPAPGRLLYPESWPPVVRAAVLLSLAVLAVYGGTFAAPFIFDDFVVVVRHPTGRTWWPPSAVGWPLANVTLGLNHLADGWDVRGYHVVNLLLHVAAGVLLFAVLHRTFMRPVLPAATHAAAFPLALGVALLWALHPLQTAVVTRIAHRSDLLGGLFGWLTLYAAIRAGEGPKSRGWAGLAVLACLGGMSASAAMAAVPVLVLLHDRAFFAGSWREVWRLRPRLYLGLAATWAWWIFLVGRGAGREVTDGVGAVIGFSDPLFTPGRALALGLKLLVWPSPLVLDYGPAAPVRLAELRPLVALVSLAGVAMVVALARWPLWGFAVAWIFLTPMPGSMLARVAGEGMAEHLGYLALAAPLAIVVAGLHAWGGRRALAGVFVLAVVWGGVAFRRNADYRSALSIWSDTVAKAPANPRAHRYLGNALLAAGRTNDAIAHYETALRLAPEYASAHFDFAGALLQANRAGEALTHYEAALRLGLDSANTQVGIATALVRLGRMPEAVAHYEAAARKGLLAAEEQLRFGQALAELGRLDDALAHLEEAVRLIPQDAGAHVVLGMVLSAAGRTPEGLRHFFEAVRLRPDDASAHAALGDALLEDLRPAEAVPHYETALRLQPERAAGLHTGLGNALATLGRVAGAIFHYEEALRINPNDREARANLARIRAAAIRRGLLKN